MSQQRGRTLRVTERERLVLAAIHVAPLAEVPLIAERVKLSPAVVRYTIQSLRKNRIIGFPVPFIDVYALGYTEYAFFVTVAHRQGDELNPADETDLTLFEGVSLMAHVSGPYNLQICLYAKNAADADKRFNSIIERFSYRVVKKTVSTRLTYRLFGYRYFGVGLGESYPVRHFGLREPLLEGTLDDLDNRILVSLGKGDGRSRRKIAVSLGMPCSTLEHRIKRLESLRAIQGYEYLFSPGSLGMRKYRLLISADSRAGKSSEKLMEIAQRDPRIVVVNECLGDWEFEVLAHLREGESIGDFCDLISVQLGGAVRTVQTVTTVRRHRLERFPFAPRDPVARRLRLVG